MSTEKGKKTARALVFHRESLAAAGAAPLADADCPSCSCSPEPSDLKSAAMAAAYAGGQTVA